MASELDKFLEERSKIPIPNSSVAKLELLAKELASGVHKRLWDENVGFWAHGPCQPGNDLVKTYYRSRWCSNDFHHDIKLLKLHGFAESKGVHVSLTQMAFNILENTEPYNVFISYKRSESSVFALLVNNTLKLNGFTPFFDMMLDPTEEWHARLEKQVKASDYFVALLGSQTHESKYTVREIFWALAYRIPVIQLWQYGYVLDPTKWQACEHPEVARELQRQQAIEVKTDDAEGYHLALEKLLNAVDATP